MEQRPSDFSGSFQEKAENPKFELDARNLKFFKEDIFHVPFRNLGESSNYKHFKHVFVDEDDYEDFKHDLVNFHNLRSRWKDDRKKVSRERPRIHSLADETFSREIAEGKFGGSMRRHVSADDVDDFEGLRERHLGTLERQRSLQIQRQNSGSLGRKQEIKVKHTGSLERRKEIQIKHSDSLESVKSLDLKRTDSTERNKEIQIKHSGSLDRLEKVNVKRTNSVENTSEIQIKHTGSLERLKKLDLQRTNSIEKDRELQVKHTGSLKRQNDFGIKGSNPTVKAKETEFKRTNSFERRQEVEGKQKEFGSRYLDQGDAQFMFKPLPMMEFFQNDEHFQEFDRVFETVKNKKRYASNSSLDKYRWSPRLEGNKSDDESDSESDDANVFPEIKVDDIFSDFFDNDDDFKNFEEEFQNFQLKRRSKALERWQRNSVCDLIEDLKAFCDSEDSTSSNKTSLPVENKLSLPKLWNQGGEWDYIFNKIRRPGPGQSASVSNSDTGRSDLTVRCDSESGDHLLDDVSDNGSCRDTGYYSESSKYNTDFGNICSACQKNSNPGEFQVSLHSMHSKFGFS